MRFFSRNLISLHLFLLICSHLIPYACSTYSRDTTSPYSFHRPSSVLTAIQPITSRDNGTRTLSFAPEGIQYFNSHIVLGSLRFGSLVSVDIKTGAAKTIVLGAGENGADDKLIGTLGLERDPWSNRLFAAIVDGRRAETNATPPFKTGGVAIMDFNGKEKKITSLSILVEGSKALNDLAFSRRMNSLFVTDVFGFKVYRLDFLVSGKYGRHRRNALSTKDVKISLFSNDPILRPVKGTAGGDLGGPNGILVHPNNFLIVGTTEGNSSRILKLPIPCHRHVGYDRLPLRPSVVPLFNLKGESIDGKLGIGAAAGFDGLEFGRARDGRTISTEVFVVAIEVILRFVSFDNYRSMTLVERINMNVPQCALSTTAVFGDEPNILYVICTTLGQEGVDAVATVTVQPLDKRLKWKIARAERARALRGTHSA